MEVGHDSDGPVINVPEHTRKIERGDGWLDIQFPRTRSGWFLLQSFNPGAYVGICSAERDMFTSTVSEVDEDRYVITVELN